MANIKITSKELEIIKDNYGKIKNKELCKMLKITDTTLRKWANKVSLFGGTKNFFLKEDLLFNKLDSEYWIGFLLADGNLFKEGTNYKISFVTKDEEIAYNFCVFTNNVIKYKKKINNGVTHYVCRFCSRVIAEKLKEYGFVERKNIDGKFEFFKPLTNNILRGYFDGDGTVSNLKNTVGFTSKSKKSLEQIQEFLGYGKITEKSNGKKKEYYELRFHSIINYIDFYNRLYKQDSKVCLKRKKNRFENRINKLSK